MAAAGSRLARAIDAAQYAVGLTVLVSIGSFLLGLLAGNGPWGVVYGLFVVGILAGGYATVLAWPRSPASLENEGRDREETRLQAFLRRFPPASWYPLAPADRYRNWIRLYLATGLMLAVSYVLNVVVGIRG